MSCPECTCDICIEEHPKSDEQIELEEIRFQSQRLNRLFSEVLGRPMTVEEAFDPRAITWAAMVGMMQVNTVVMGLNAAIHRLMELQGDDK